MNIKFSFNRAIPRLCPQKIICTYCNGSGTIDFGCVQKKCDKCINLSDFFSVCIKIPIEKYFIEPVKKNCVSISMGLFFLIVFCSVWNGFSPTTQAFAIAAFGAIFTSLKFKLDQASYHKDLFEKRYEIFAVINAVLKDWSSDSKSHKEMTSRISGDLMRRSYFLFGRETYKFIVEFRKALIYTEKHPEEENDNKHREEIIKYRNFLSSLHDGQKLSDYFSELKIYNY